MQLFQYRYCFITGELHVTNLLSGLGTVAGSVGGMSGYEVTRGRFGEIILYYLNQYQYLFCLFPLAFPVNLLLIQNQKQR